MKLTTTTLSLSAAAAAAALAVVASIAGAAGPPAEPNIVTLNQVAAGYRGIWYFNQPSGDQYVYKYSGGFATYPQQQSPIAIYAGEVNKTFFVYGGSLSNSPESGKPELLHMVSYYDHKTGMVPKPTLLLNKHTDDAHDNPLLSIDEDGYLWVFSNAHGTSRPSYVHRSRKPYDIRDFELIRTTNFSYGHIWRQPGKGFTFLHTLYENGGRSLYLSLSSPDGRQWEKPVLLSRFHLGHYQVTTQERTSAGQGGDRIASAFDMHPNPVGLNERTNIYYMETRDRGKTWKNARGETLQMPLRDANNPALVHDYLSEGLKVYLKEVAFGRDGHPVILYLTSKGYNSGPANGVRKWYTARWTGSEWQIRHFADSDHNYDHGGLWIEPDGAWRIVAPTEPGPQPYTTGGDMVMWLSRDQGATWNKIRQLTHSKLGNHTYAKKPVNAHPDFYALWADGDTLKPSNSNIYFTNKEGSAVWMLPEKMTADFERPRRVE
ncbi:MAG: BNR-4 repeat-containing protein [Acidobacteria bacterium]|nr:BNR-4 repeat-containing protein [Acidobacteriota bacterium]